jgi:sugar-specific transcriptional regulator TrmB|nr:helix-turn-helix domain-containing protein [Candidatus Krumholzibacteria bacterium]
MADLTPAIEQFKKLGMTSTEAGTYLATLQEAAQGPVSAYKVAQALGKDPANLGKTLTALERQGAVRSVQDKPRLYLPVPVAEFTETVLSRLKEVGDDLVTQLRDYELDPPSGMTLSLRNNQQALDQAALLLKSCQSELLIYASRDVMDYLARDFGDLASVSNCRVRFLGAEKSGVALAENTLVPMNTGDFDTPDLPWLHMIADRKRWLVAQFNRPEGAEFPCGWWGDDPAMASILAGPFDLACRPTTVKMPEVESPVEVMPEDVPETLEEMPEDVPATVEEFAAGAEEALQGVVPEPTPVPPEPVVPPAGAVDPEDPEGPEDPDDGDEEQNGLQFVVRHDQDD